MEELDEVNGALNANKASLHMYMIPSDTLEV